MTILTAASRALFKRAPTTSQLVAAHTRAAFATQSVHVHRCHQSIIVAATNCSYAYTNISSPIHTRALSTTPSPPTDNVNKPPDSLTPEAGLAAQDAMRLFIEHGIGKRALQEIAADGLKEDSGSTFIDRWQRMIHTYLQTQCGVIQLLGYSPDERGIGMYTQHLSQALQNAHPEMQEKLRVVSRDTYRMVLGGAFDVPLLEEQELKGEMSIVDARNMMHKVSLRMQDAEVLEKVAKACSVSVAMNDSPEAQQIDMARKHTVVQQIMVGDVYLGSNNNNGTSLVEECGFGKGEKGYVRMQSALAEHQSDPLITQYVGSAMIQLLKSAGIDVEAMQRQYQG